MGTRLFHVKVVAKKADTVVLRLRIISAEQPGFYDGKSFALMLLYDPIVNARAPNAPLGERVTFENTNDAGWARAHVDAYVRSCRLFDVTNHPIAVDLVAMTGAERRRFFKSSVAPHASLEIVVTDPRWIAHLKRGQTWETAAYDALF
jgi:hypothetical protein